MVARLQLFLDSEAGGGEEPAPAAHFESDVFDEFEMEAVVNVEETETGVKTVVKIEEMKAEVKVQVKVEQSDEEEETEKVEVVGIYVKQGLEEEKDNAEIKGEENKVKEEDECWWKGE